MSRRTTQEAAGRTIPGILLAMVHDVGGSARRTQADEHEEGWVVLSPDEAPKDSISPSIRKSAYYNFQLNINFGKHTSSERPTAPPEQASIKKIDERIVHPQGQSPLFQLPAEIRLDIYDHVLRIPVKLDAGVQLAKRRTCDCHSSCLALLATCRRVLDEAEDLFYAINRLSVEHPRDLCATLGPRRRSAVTSFTQSVSSAANAFDRLQQLRAFPNLTSLHFRRSASIKYLDVSTWAIMSHQMAAEIRGMKRLVDVRISTPEALDLKEHEVVRQRKLEEIDRRICDAARDRDL